MTPITVKQLDYLHQDSRLLRESQQREISDLRPIGPGIPATAANVPVFLVAYDGDEPVGSGRLRPLNGQEAETKRIYVVPSR